MTEVQKHPEYQEELKRLSETVDAIRESIKNTTTTHHLGGDAWATHNLQRFGVEKVERLRSSESNPYFGRVDFATNGNYQKIYLGYQALDLVELVVYDWRAPVGRLFYGSVAERQSYQTPGGKMNVRLQLKRHYMIKDSNLLDIADEIDRRTGVQKVSRIVSNEAYLLQFLYSRGDPRLQDIVKTIQEQQDRIIRAPFAHTLIINGVAGSGKTSIAYHRLAYLLYPNNQFKINPRRTIVFGPNKLFLSYVAELLPRLGINEIQQVSFDEWALERMQVIQTNRYTIHDTSLQVFVDSETSREERIKHWKRARLKGGGNFQRVLQKYVEFLRTNFSIPKNGFLYSNIDESGLTLFLSAQEIANIYNRYRNQKLPLIALRNRLLSELNKLLASKYAQSVERRALEIQEQDSTKAAEQFKNRANFVATFRRRILQRVSVNLKTDIDKYWPLLSWRDAYYQLLSNYQLLKSLGKGLLTDEEISLLVSNEPEPDGLELEDIPSIYYLYILVNGKPKKTYDHIVIDEAQDLSPIQFYLLRMHSSNSSMTILGDIAQGIYAHRGISDWSDIKPIFEQDQLYYEEIKQNYRSTREIVAFTNKVLRKIRGEQAILAEPFNRSGELPRITEASDESSMYAEIAKDISLLREQKGITHIGVIMKTNTECEIASRYLKRSGISVSSVILSRDTQFDYGGGVVILPVALSKGIEFQAAFIVNVSKERYDGTVQYDGRLLYVGVTRALHYLNLYAIGEMTTLLETAKTRAVINRV